MPPPSRNLMMQFLKEDFFDSLRWLFEGAVAWQAARSAPEHCRHQIVLAMHTSLLQARSLYEFYYPPSQRDDARASQFASGWRPNQTALYRSYMSGGKPANKRLFHLVFERPRHAGGTSQNELKNRVLDFATDIKQITEDFAVHADLDFRQLVRDALHAALGEAAAACAWHKVGSPL